MLFLQATSKLKVFVLIIFLAEQYQESFVVIWALQMIFPPLLTES
jgi:hypothetical protein